MARLADALAMLLVQPGARFGDLAVMLPFLLLASLGATPGFVLAVAVLAVLEGVLSLFDVSSMFSYLETAKVGRAGFYGAVVGLGSATGGFLGGYVAMQFGFTVLFVLCSLIYVGTLITFLLQFRRPGSSAG